MNVSKAVYELLGEAFSEYLLPINIGVSKNIEEGSMVQKPLLQYDSGKNKCNATNDYLALTEYIIHSLAE